MARNLRFFRHNFSTNFFTGTVLVLLVRTTASSSSPVVAACSETPAQEVLELASKNKPPPVYLAPDPFGCLCGPYAGGYVAPGAHYSCWQGPDGYGVGVESRLEIFSFANRPTYQLPPNAILPKGGGDAEGRYPQLGIASTTSTAGGARGQTKMLLFFVLGGLFLVGSVGVATVLLCCARKGGEDSAVEQGESSA